MSVCFTSVLKISVQIETFLVIKVISIGRVVVRPPQRALGAQVALWYWRSSALALVSVICKTERREKKESLLKEIMYGSTHTKIKNEINTILVIYKTELPSFWKPSV